MWIHVFCLLSQVLNEFDMSRTGLELVRFHWHVSSRENLVISRETHVDTPNLFTEPSEFTWTESVELVNSLTEHVKLQVVVCWVKCFYKSSATCFQHNTLWVTLTFLPVTLTFLRSCLFSCISAVCLLSCATLCFCMDSELKLTGGLFFLTSTDPTDILSMLSFSECDPVTSATFSLSCLPWGGSWGELTSCFQLLAAAAAATCLSASLQHRHLL